VDNLWKLLANGYKDRRRRKLFTRSDREEIDEEGVSKEVSELLLRGRGSNKSVTVMASV
jgi:hypothetical protein